VDGFDAAGACGGAFEIRSAGDGRTAQDKSTRRAGVDSARGHERRKPHYDRGRSPGYANLSRASMERKTLMEFDGLDRDTVLLALRHV
jgi:hypothetical protein